MEPLLKWMLEEIALDGLQGATLASLWKRIQEAELNIVDDFVKAAIWDALRQREDLEFFRVTGSKLPGGIRGFLAHERDSLPRESLGPLAAIDRADTLRIVASAASRASALTLTTEKAASMPTHQYTFLEMIAATRHEGLKQRELAHRVNMAPKSVFHHLKALDLRLHLIVRTPILDTSTAPHAPTNLLYFRRFAPANLRAAHPDASDVVKSSRVVERDSEGEGDDDEEDDEKSRKKSRKDESTAKFFLYPAFMQEICKQLDSAKDKVRTVDDVKKYFGVGRKRGEQSHPALEGSSVKLALRRFLTAKGKLVSKGCVAEFIAHVKNEKGQAKETKCLRLLKPYTSEEGASGEESSESDEQEEGKFFTHELPMLYQFYKLVEESGTMGVSQGELFHLPIGMDRKGLLRKLNVLVEQYGVVRIADVTERGASNRRTMTYRLFTRGNFAKKEAEEKGEGRAEIEQVPSVQGSQPSESAAPSHSSAPASQGSVQAAPTPEATVAPKDVQRKRPITTLEKKRGDLVVQHLEKVKVTLSMHLRAVLSPLDGAHPLDHKTLRRLVTTLATSGQINTFEVTYASANNNISYSSSIPLLSGQQRGFTIVCHHLLKLEDATIQEFLQVLRQEEGMNAYQHIAPRKILEVDETLTEVERLRVPGSMESTAVPDNSQWLAVARNQGYVRALMVRVKLLHQFLLSEFLFDTKSEQPLPPGQPISCTLSVILERMPLQIFLQVLGHTRPIEGLEALIAQAIKIGDLPVALRYLHTDCFSTDLFTKRLPEHRLRRLLEPLHRLHLVAPARPNTSVIASPEGVGKTKAHELQVPAGELLIYTQVSASWNTYAFTSREVVAQYWGELESACVHATEKALSIPTHECVQVPEATEPRNWMFETITVPQRMLLEANMPTELPPSREHSRVQELAQLTKLTAATVFRYLEREFARKRRRAAAKEGKAEEEDEEEEAESSGIESSSEERPKPKRKKRRDAGKKRGRKVRRDDFDREEQEAADDSLVPLAQLTGEIADPSVLTSGLPAAPVSEAASHVAAFINRKRRQREAKRAEEQRAGREAEGEEEGATTAAADKDTQSEKALAPHRSVWSHGQDMRLLRLYLENTAGGDTDWDAIAVAFSRPARACKGRFRTLLRFPQFKSAVDVGLAPAATVSADLPVTLAEFHQTYRVVATTPVPPTPREQLVRDCAVIVLQPPEDEYKPEQANAILRQFSEVEVLEAFEWLKMHGLISRIRRVSVRSYQLAASFHRAVDARLPATLLGECSEWLHKQRQQQQKQQQQKQATPNSQSVDRFASGGHVAALVEQCFAAGAVGLSATLSSSAAAAQPASAAALLNVSDKGEAEKDAEEHHKLPEWHLRVTSPSGGVAPPFPAPRLLTSLAPPAQQPPSGEFRFEVPALEDELRGEASLAILVSLYRTAEAGGIDGVAVNALAAVCAPASLQPLLSKLEQRWLLIRVAALDHHRLVARVHARPWCVVCPPAPVAVVRPWLKPDGSIHKPFFDALQLRLLTSITRSPGVSLESLCEQLQPAIAPQHVIDVLEALATAGLLSFQTIDAPTPSLFATEGVKMRCCFPSPGSYSLYAQEARPSAT